MADILAWITGQAGFRGRLERSRPRLYRTAYAWCHDAALADDLVQETLLKALKNGQQMRDEARLDGWLFRILANCWRDHFRHARDAEDIDEIICAGGDTPEALHAQTELVARVRAAVAKLPLGQRQVLTLVDLEGFSYAECAEILAIPAGTVMSRVCRARQALKRDLLDLAASGLRRVK